MGFFVRNTTGVPVHVRLDEIDAAAKNYRFTFSREKVRGGRPLLNVVLATDMPLLVAWLDDRSDYVIDDRLRLTFDEYVDSDGDFILCITGFAN